MPAVSKTQRRFMAMCEHGIHTRVACPKMSRAAMREFATTPDKGLPQSVETPGALASFIGRKKYGKKSFQKMAAKGRSSEEAY